jgi:alpha/beta superfamily hydrolase
MKELPVNITYFPTEDTHALLTGPAGLLEIITQYPNLSETISEQGVVVICHPNPTQGGTMHNKVVYTLAKAYLAKGFKVVRFNYRGVGQSEGEFGQAIGEVADLDAVITWVKKVLGDATPLYLAGFSFGTYISAYWAITHHWPIEQLISVAPAVDRLDFDKLISEYGSDLATKKINWVIIQGDQDEVVPSEAVYQWVEHLPESLKPYVKVERFPETGHFFHGKLVPLKDALMKYILTK